MAASSSSQAQEVILYPAYIDAAKSWRQGRRVAKSAAVERPWAPEMYDAVTSGLNLQARLEMNKLYSRDWLTPGRIRVTLRTPQGQPCNSECATKAALLVKCSDLCKQHADRAKRIAEMLKIEASMFSGGAAVPKDSKAGSSGAEKAAKTGRKKGKKK